MAQYNTDIFNVKMYDKNGVEYSIDTSSIESLYFIEDIFSFCIDQNILVAIPAH